jgi:hypothetical protein
MIWGLVVEGDRDAAAYPELIRKIRNDVDFILAEPCGNDVKLMRQFVNWLKHFEWHADHRVEKALVIRDSDCEDSDVWEERMGQLLERCRFAPRFPVHFHATKCEIETWLLADERAINQVATSRGKGRAVPPTTIQLESHRDAKELFRKALSGVGLPADPRVYQEIARAVNIDRIAARCQHFERFRAKVMAC